MTRTITADLVMLAKAFDDGDDSAIYPLTDCLLENGWPEHCRQIWHMYDDSTRTRTAFLGGMLRGKIAEMVDEVQTLNKNWIGSYTKELLERFPIP